MEIIKTFTKNNKTIDIYGSFDKPLFKVQQIGISLGFGNIRSSLSNVRKEWKLTQVQVMDNGKPPVKTSYLTESGLYYLLMRSNKEECLDFQSWICEDVIPSIRKTGQYKIQQEPIRKKLCFKIENEFDLHTKLVNFIQNYYPNALIVATLGENQDSIIKRIKSKQCGYQKGSPDLIINNLHKTYRGLAIELKTPKGRGIVSEHQIKMLNLYKNNGFKTLLSNDYDECVKTIIEYFQDVRIKCEFCNSKFKNEHSLLNHQKGFHKICNYFFILY